MLVGSAINCDLTHVALLHVFYLLVELPDWHLLTSAIDLTLALITRRTDLCSVGVFRADKTRAAAAVVVGFIAIDLSLSIMICTKENAATQVVAEHIGISARTAIDAGSQNRNQVLRGRFRQKTAQEYSLILEWMDRVHLCLYDEVQRFGNLDEVAALARLSPFCLCIWTGDHKQILRKQMRRKPFARR